MRLKLTKLTRVLMKFIKIKKGLVYICLWLRPVKNHVTGSLKVLREHNYKYDLLYMSICSGAQSLNS